MATFSFLTTTIFIILIINTKSIDSQRLRGFPRIERIISKPDSDFDDFDFDDDFPSPFGRFPMRAGPISPLPLMPNPLLGGIGNPLGGIGNPLGLGINPMTRLFPNPFQHQNPYLNGMNRMPSRQEEFYTAIGYDKMDPSSQMRITITERSRQGPGMVNPILGGPLFPGMDFDDGFDADYNAPTDWYIQGAFYGSQIKNKAGTYYLVVTQYGRSADGCVSESLGPILSPEIVDMNNPFLQNSVPSGVIANPVLLGSGGPTVYASTLEGVSRRQLVGAGIAACQYINNGVCGGYIPFCATISKDVLPAMEVPLAPNTGPTTITFDPFDFDSNNLGFQQGGMLQRPGGDNGILSFADEDRSNAFIRPQALAKPEQQTGSNNVLGLLF